MPSLRRHFTAWLGAGSLAFLLLAAGAETARQGLMLAGQQDERLLELARSEPAALPVASDAAIASAVLWRHGDRAGGRLQGNAALPPYPWAAELQSGEAPHLYYTHADGTLLRAAVVLRPTMAGGAEILQVAEPARLRVPGAAALADGWLPAFIAGVLAMAALAGMAAMRARSWILATLRDFEAVPPQPSATPSIASSTVPAEVGRGSELTPAELALTLDKLRALQTEQQRWVDEQRRFVADAAHQLRTPMAVLRAQLQSALTDGADARPLLADMLHTVDRATGMANQLLSLTRIEQLKRSGGLDALPVAAAAREAVVELSPLIARKRLDFNLEGDDFQAPADSVMLGELLRNLLANAIHHSPAGSRMGVVLRGAAPLRELVVWDEGPGIDDAVKPRLFTPFSAGKGGVGLGLSICQQIAAAMGAEVRLHNRVDEGRVIGVDAVLHWKAP